MCGFVGFVGGTDNQSEVLTKMMDRIVHRGPDMGGQFIDGRVAWLPPPVDPRPDRGRRSAHGQ